MPTKYRRVSAPVYQGPTSAHCWAAAMQYWLDVTPNRSRLTKDELISMYAKKYPDGALDPLIEFQLVKDDNGMRSENIIGSSLTSNYVFEKLGLGHLFIGYEIPGNKYGHCIVVYGIADDTLNFMDPARAGHWYRRLSYYSEAKMTVAWPND